MVKKSRLRWLPITLGLITLGGLASYYYFWDLEWRYEEVGYKLEEIGELVTLSRVYRSILYSRETSFLIREKSFLFSAEFEVQAGIDLGEGLRVERSEGRTILHLPSPRILLIDGREDSYRDYILKEQFSKVSTDDFLPLLAEEKKRIRRQALESGLLEEAESAALEILRGIFKSYGIRNLEFRFYQQGEVYENP